MDCIVHGVTKSRTRLSIFHLHCLGSPGSCHSNLETHRWSQEISKNSFPGEFTCRQDSGTLRSRKSFVFIIVIKPTSFNQALILQVRQGSEKKTTASRLNAASRPGKSFENENRANKLHFT